MLDNLRRFSRSTLLLFALAATAGAATWATAEERSSPEQPAETPSGLAAPATALADALDREVARAEHHLGQLDTFATELRSAGESEHARLEASRTRAAELAAELQLHSAGSADVSALYARINAELQLARPSLRDALDRTGLPLAVPTFEPRLDPAGLDVSAMENRVRLLGELRREIDSRRIALAADERELRWESVDGWGSITAYLNDLRIVAIEHLPAGRRRQVLGLSAEGIEQLRQEVGQLELSARLYRARELNQIGLLPGKLVDVFAVGSLTWTMLKFLAAVVLFLFVRRRGPRIRRAAYRFVDQGAATRAGRRRGAALVAVLEVVAPWGLFLGLIELLRWTLGPLARTPELDLPLRVATIYGLYRLAIDALFASTVRIAGRYKLSLDEGRTAHLLRSVRTMMRVLIAILVLLTFSELFVGHGFLYHLVVRFSWIFVLAAALLLLARWREVIADGYLKLGRTGRLAALVRHSRDRWYGVFVSAAAFVLLAGRALVLVGRDTAMGFDQTRRALAFIFRRRVEKRAEQGGYAEFHLDDLPQAVVEAFAEEPLSADMPKIDHFPGLDRLQQMIDPWLADEVGASFLLTGEKGMGKTSWLNRIDPGETPIGRVTLTHRLLSESRLVGTLSKELELSLDEGAGMIALHKTLLNGPKRMVTVDLGQNLFLSKVGGYDTFETFVSLVEATCGQVFWVCSISAFAWDHLAAVRPDLMVFRDRETLKAWSEEQIGEMLEARTTAAGIEVVYDDLLLETRPTPDSSRRRETAQQYMRLLWDTSDGNPRAALHYWLRSLVPDTAKRMRVRLFRAPTSVDLEPLGERARFLLAAIVVHENLSLSEAEIVTRYPRAVCRLQLERLVGDGILRRTNGRYRLTTHFHRAVVRFLKRSNLLSD